MSLCPSSSHQLVAAAIAFRHARHKFPKDFGLQNAVERIPASAKAEATTNRDGTINQAKSSSSLVRHVCNSRSEHVCPASVARGRDHGYSCMRENSLSIKCSYCRGRGGAARTKNDADTSQLRNECSGGDAIDTVPSRECEEFATSGVDKNEFVKEAERVDTVWKTTDEEPTKMTEWAQQPGHRTFYHRKTYYPLRGCANLNSLDQLCDASHKRKDEVACGDFLEDRSKLLSTSCRKTSIDLDRVTEEGIVTRDARSHELGIEDVWTKLDILVPRREIGSACRYRCNELHSRKPFNLDLLKLSCDSCCDKCCYRNYNRDCFHRCCYCREHNETSINAKGYDMHERISDRKAQHKSCRDSMQDENSRLCTRYCCSKNSAMVSAIREQNDEEHEDDDVVAVINHKDSMCILAEKYKANKRCRGERRGRDKIEARVGNRTCKDECNKSLTSEIIDQQEPFENVNAVPHEDPSMKHVCRAHCVSCGTAITSMCSRGRQYALPEVEFNRLKSPLKETAAHYYSKRAPYKRIF